MPPDRSPFRSRLCRRQLCPAGSSLALAHLACVALLAICLGTVASESPAQAKGTYEPPCNGLESPDRSHRMKSNPGAGALVDAYGFPVQNVAPERPQARRLPPGAYGGYGNRGRDRPLPDDRDNRPLWR